ncbi:MAG TPA: acetate--CoA ligase family protein [Kineosporiaceae bacterium]|nr:acetate--CoA ligase family protein [Kineosporiaceae bacterium]
MTWLLDALFTPRRIAVVGASDRPGTLGALLMANLASFPGEVVPLRAGQSLLDVDRPVDLAVVAVPARAAPGVAADAAAAGVPVMVVLSGGFAETGPDGAALQAELLAAAGGPGPGRGDGRPRVRIVGPNCFGVQNCDLPLNASIAAGIPDGGGGISLVSQSGAYGMAIHDLARDEGMRFAKVCVSGNTCDVTATELLDALARDDATRTLCFLLESLPDGRSFVERARRVTADKPVVVLKSGRSGAGARAAASHTAALAGREAVWGGAFRQAGIVEVTSGQELLDAARAIDGQPLPHGDRVGIVTNSGGTGVELADLLGREGLTVPELSVALQRQIRQLLPAHGSPRNPVDLTPAWSIFSTAYPALVELLARSGEVDAVVPVLLQRAAADRAAVDGVRAAVDRLRADAVDVPVVVCWVAPRSVRAHAYLLQAAGVPVLEWPVRTARAIGRAREAARARERLSRRAAGPVVRAVPVRPGTDADHPDADHPGPDDPVALAAWLRAAGVPVVDAALCRTPAAAAAAARVLPAVVKVAQAAHRSDAAGVRLGLADADAVAAAAADLLTRADAVLVSPQLTGVEVAVGAVRDEAFGPVVMVGLGGVWVEVLDDVAFATAPLDRVEARDLLATLRAYPLLTGARGTPAVDLDALADVVVAVGAALMALPDVRALDLNPVLAGPGGAIAVDWKVTV